jgi:hypothetical protein
MIASPPEKEVQSFHEVPKLGALMVSPRIFNFCTQPQTTNEHTVSQAYFALHKTSHEVQDFYRKKKYFFLVLRFTSEAFLSLSQNLKVTCLRGGTQTKL